MKVFALLAAFGFGLVAWATARSQAPATNAAKDAHGDPIPAGAKFRLGTIRFMAPSFSPWDGTHMALAPDGKSYAVTAHDIVAIYASDTGLELWKKHDADGADGNHTGDLIAFNDDGSAVVTSGTFGLAIWDAKTGKQLVAAARPGEHRKLAISSDFTIAASVFSNEGKTKITIWNPTNGKVADNLGPAVNDIRRIAFSPKGRVLAAFGSYTAKDESEAELKKQAEHTNVVELWDVNGKKELPRIQLTVPEKKQLNDDPLDLLMPKTTPPDLRLSADGSVLYTVTPAGVESWDTATGKRIKKFIGRSQTREGLWLAPDGKRLAAVGNDGSVDVWATESGERIATGKQPVGERWTWQNGFGCGLSGSITASPAPLFVAFPPDGAPLVVATYDVHRVRVGGLNGAKQQPSGHRNDIRTMTYSADGKQIISVGGTQAIHWNAETGKQLGAAINLGEDAYFEGDGAGFSGEPVLSPSGRFLAVQAEGIKLIDVATGTEHLTFPIPEEFSVKSMQFSNDNKYFMAASYTFNQDDNTNPHMVQVWNTETGRAVFEKRLDGSDTRHVSLSLDGSKVYWATERTVKGGEETVLEWAAWDVATAKKLGSVEVPSDAVEVVVPLADNRSILTNNDKGKLAMLDIVAGKVTRTFDIAVPNTLFGSPIIGSPDGKWFALKRHPVLDDDGKVTKPAQLFIHDSLTGKVIRQLTLHESVSEFAVSAVSPDGKFVVTSEPSGTALVWDIPAVPAK